MMTYSYPERIEPAHQMELFPLDLSHIPIWERAHQKPSSERVRSWKIMTQDWTKQMYCFSFFFFPIVAHLHSAEAFGAVMLFFECEFHPVMMELLLQHPRCIVAYWQWAVFATCSAVSLVVSFKKTS